jgi:hypothetical protein
MRCWHLTGISNVCQRLTTVEKESVKNCKKKMKNIFTFQIPNDDDGTEFICKGIRNQYI